MKKCKGCGVILQSLDKERPGYVLDTKQEYCQRCFRLTHYGDSSFLNKETISNEEIINIYKNYSKDLFVLVIDALDSLCLDSDKFLDNYRNYNLLIVINKIDLLPRNINDDKLEDLFKKVLLKCSLDNLLGVILTYKNDSNFNSVFFDTLNDLRFKKVVMVGKVNAGKTTIINKILGNNDLTVSLYPGTTVKENIIEHNDYTFVDTPGLIDNNSFISLLDKKLIKDIVPDKCIKPRVFQLYENESYIVEGLLKVDVFPKGKASISFSIRNSLNIHRTKYENSENYLNKHLNEYRLKLSPFSKKELVNDKDSTYYIKGLGFLRIIGKCNVKINIYKDVLLYKCGVKL